MGAFGTGPFDNDDALDLLGECVESPALMLRIALQAVRGEYVEVDVGGRAWAAAEIVALTFGSRELSGRSCVRGAMRASFVLASISMVASAEDPCAHVSSSATAPASRSTPSESESCRARSSRRDLAR